MSSTDPPPPPDSMQPRSKEPYRKHPTPHPRKESVGSYFDLEVDPKDTTGLEDNEFPQGPMPKEEEGPGIVRPGYFARTYSDVQLESPNKWMNPFESRKLEEKRPSLSKGLSFTSQDADEDEEPDEDIKLVRPPLEFDPNLSYKEKVSFLRQRGREIVEHFEDYEERQDFVIWLAKSLLHFGAPSHRIDSQLNSAAEILNLHVGFVHLPNLIIVTFLDSDTHTYRTRYVRANGRVALTALHKIHLIYRDVLHDRIGVAQGSRRLRNVLRAPPLYPTWLRCLFAFICASVICTTAFGGAFADMFISGASAAVLQFLGLRAAAKSAIYANVYEISVAIIVSFLARALGSLRSQLFCFSAISSAGVVLVLPGFTVLISALELTSKNIMCGSVRMVYAIIYTLFLGFSLTIGSELYAAINKRAIKDIALAVLRDSIVEHGSIMTMNATADYGPLTGSFAFMDSARPGTHVVKGCYRNPSWPWYRQPLPWWTLFILVPIYSICSSMANLQAWRSIQLPVMVTFSCLAYAANRGANQLISSRGDIVSAFGALVIGLCGNVYSRLVGGTAFTAMVTGVLFLVPSAIGNGGGLIQNYKTSSAQYSNGFGLGVRMIQVAIGVTIGLFLAQVLVYALGRRKNAAHFAF